MKQFLEKYLKIYVHESSRFLWIAAIFFVVFFVTAIFRNYVDAAFLKRYGPQYIPWMLVINALLTFVVFGLVDRLARRFMDHSLLSGILAIYAASTVVLFFMVKADISIAYPILYQLLFLLDSILLVYLWNMAGDLFDARQGKRIFPLITAGQVLGTTLGSFTTKPLTLLIGDDPTLIFFGVVCLGVGIFLFRTGPSLFGATRPKRGPAKAASSGTKKLTEVPGLIAKYPIVRYLIITGLIPNILLPIFFYQFSVIANNTFTSEQSLISFLSIFRGMTTLMTFVLLFFMGRLYQRMGLTNASLVHPINFTILFTSLGAFFNIYVAMYGQFTAILIQRAIAGPVNKILYSIIPPDLIAWSRSFIRGTVLKIGMLFGSLMMIVLKPVLDVRMFSFLAVGFAVYWVLETLLFRRHYKRILKQVIVEQQIDFDQIESVRTFDSGAAAMELGPVSVEDRGTEIAELLEEVRAIEPDVALKLLDDPDPDVRAEAAASFSHNQDIRAVRKLLKLLEETSDNVRNAAIEALMTYRERILPFLEVTLVESNPRLKQGILEVIRLSGVKDFELIPFLGKELSQAYGNLIAIRQLRERNGSESVAMLKECLEEINEEILRLIFYALWVHHADMRLMYEALQSESASIAVEMVENSINRDITPYLIPLIEDIPVDEKIERGRELLPIIRSDNLERLLTLLAEARDPLTRLLALYVIAEEDPKPGFVPVIESRLTDESPYVRQLAEYALARTNNEVAEMPEILEIVNNLKSFSILEGMGVRELHALASVLNVETFETGDIMIKEGEENSAIYLLVSGTVDIYAGHGTPNEVKKATIGEGAFLGELSLFTRMPPNATCVAATETQAYVLPHHRFVEIMKVYPQIGINLCRFFSQKLREATY
jgi:HEAT repeat protein